MSSEELARLCEARPEARRAEVADTSTRIRPTEMEDTRSFRPDFVEAPRQRRYAADEDAH